MGTTQQPAPAAPGVRPRTPAQLHAFIKDELGITVPGSPLIPDHTAPFDYLAHAFFEGQARPDAPAPPTPADPGRPPPVDTVVWAARGAGKTFLGALATALDLVFKPGIQVRILAGSLEQASRMHEHLRALFAEPILAELVDGKITDRRIRLTNGSRAELLAQSQTAVRGTRVQKLRCDEVELFEPAVWEAAQLTTRSADCGGVPVRGAVECFSTMHLPHGLMQQIVAEAREGRRTLFRWGVVDALESCGPEHRCAGNGPDSKGPNGKTKGTPAGAGIPETQTRPEGSPATTSMKGDPHMPFGDFPPCPLWDECRGRAKSRRPDAAGHLAVADAILMKQRVSLPTWRAEMLCLRPSRSQAVIPEFDPKLHVVADLPPDREIRLWACGIDFGFRAPTVVLWAALDHRGVLWIADERARSGAVTDEHARAILESPWPVPEWIGIDPAGRQANDQTAVSNAQVLRRHGLHVHWRSMGIIPGLELIRARLRPADGLGPRLLIHERCRRLIESLEKYHYPENPRIETPVKDGYDHAVDALRYLLACLDVPYRTVGSRYA